MCRLEVLFFKSLSDRLELLLERHDGTNATGPDGDTLVAALTRASVNRTTARFVPLSTSPSQHRVDALPRRTERTPMLSTLPPVDVVAKARGTAATWSSPVSELDLEKKLAVQVI